MNDWKILPFKKIITNESVSYGIVQPGVTNTPNSVPVLRVNNFQKGRLNIKNLLYVDKSIEDKYSRTRLNGGELLITVVGNVGECLIAPDYTKGWNVARAIAVANISEDFDKKFIASQFQSENVKFQLYGRTNDTVQPTLNLSDLKEIVLNIPPLAEQKAIAAVLGSLDDKIDLLHRQNATLERMAEILFRQWFIEEAQEEWEKCSLGDIVSIFRGASPRPIVNYVKGGNIPWIKIADATSTYGLFLFKTREFIITDGIKKSVEVYPGDLILSNSATCGIPLFVGIYGCIHDGWLLFRNFRKLSKEYVFFFLKSISQKLNSIADGSVQNNLNTNLLKDYPIKIPPKEKLNTFNIVVSQHIAKIKSNQLQIQTLEKLRDTLLPKLMSGEVRVRVDE